MSNIKQRHLLLLLFFFTLFLSAHLVQGLYRVYLYTYTYREKVVFILGYEFTVFCGSTAAGCRAEGSNEAKMKRSWRRLMIGSTAPTCTYNECRGCKSKCSAQQVPVEGNDPINSAYHYKCVCHRS
ncbi:hypothetical protein HRI_001290100 [Hibiscus trionum]|uniref:Stomagen C-terminal domain-containing protein n=1 Tax=Hibiscus trionum TaxID=183268 RepID=A0A9W7HEY8_HIBTR|nr:hypothetical protein HRI_001290100 [Hibiscus trionum]